MKIRMNKKLAIFDRDSTLIFDDGYTHDVSKLEWMPGVLELLKFLAEQKIFIAVATNQSGIERGYFSSQQVDEFHGAMNSVLQACSIDEIVFFVCPHLPTLELANQCNCRKPQPGLLLEAIEHFRVSREEAIFVGDKESDYYAAINAGIDFLQADSDGKWIERMQEVFK
jgi:D-glycero-D-manno-heptose 1,7-bisphosphate phosphatase